ncbi:hypothetical protein BC829DRAFT_414780 [Chytridium lagenaria]|nr:hypothetical protein BC829DRAFT_414780 [Chytridium lagenaria]
MEEEVVCSSATILAYYKNEKEYELLKIIPLADVHAVAEVRDLKRRKNVLGVVTRQRTYYIMCDTKEQLEEWLNTIKDAHREVQRLMKKDSLASSQRILTSTLGALSAPLPSTTTSGNNIVQWEPNAALGPSSATGSPKLEPRVRFVDAQNVSTSRQGSGFFVNTAGLDTNFSLQSMSPTSPLNTGTLPGDASDAQSQKSNLSSALTMESMLTIISTPSMIQGPSSSLPTPVVPVTAPTLPTHPHRRQILNPPILNHRYFVTDTSVEHRPSQGSIGAVRPITGILINRNAGSPAVGSATSQKPSYRRETVLSSSEEEDEGGNESDGTINDNKVVCEGYLYKQGTKYKQSWKKRWIVLRNGKITCYKNNGEYVVKRMVPLRNVLDVHEVDQQGRHQHCFKVVLSKRALTLSAESAEDLQRWVTVLRAAHKTVMRRIAQEGDNEE